MAISRPSPRRLFPRLKRRHALVFHMGWVVITNDLGSEYRLLAGFPILARPFSKQKQWFMNNN